MLNFNIINRLITILTQQYGGIISIVIAQLVIIIWSLKKYVQYR